MEKEKSFLIETPHFDGRQGRWNCRDVISAQNSQGWYEFEKLLRHIFTT